MWVSVQRTTLLLIWLRAKKIKDQMKLNELTENRDSWPCPHHIACLILIFGPWAGHDLSLSNRSNNV
ncbi:uncharacterized protein VTP21DRAFT_2476 [Calcarisporiella thermophila]|uniref:uncharacterized protein n=1 Tax=Calcarisporiella thermophila TaxID=911321 RepID=UPI003742D127